MLQYLLGIHSERRDDRLLCTPLWNHDLAKPIPEPVPTGCTVPFIIILYLIVEIFDHTKKHDVF